MVATASINANTGGMVEGPAGTPVEGVKVEVPPGALDTDADISLGSDDGSVTPVLGEFGGLIVTVSTTGDHIFQQPVKITMPFRGPANSLPIPYYIDDGGGLRLVDLASIDTDKGTFSFYTFHASSFTYLRDNPPGFELNWRGGTFDSDFKPQLDGFNVVNGGSTINRGGECTGFTAFSQWYYATQATSGGVRTSSPGGLYGQFTARVPTTGAPSSLDYKVVTGQDVIVTRAWTSINLVFSSYYPRLAAQFVITNDQDMYRLTRNAIANTRRPVMLHITTSKWNYYLPFTPDFQSHSVLAYKADNGTLSIYDPNYPFDPANPTDSDRRITIPDGPQLPMDTFNPPARFDPYLTAVVAGAPIAAYTNIYYIGDGSLATNESYSSIYQDALKNFNGEENAKVQVTSHASGDSVTERTPTIQGKISSGRIFIEKLRVIANGQSVETLVAPTGDFSVVVPLRSGKNELGFVTLGKLVGRGLVATPNDQRSGPFLLTGNFPAAAVVVTLTWDKSDTDVDLYVTDPQQDTSWFLNRVTRDGGTLDKDNTQGKGPEHFTLTFSNTVRYGSEYTVRAHYFDDRGHGPANWHVNVLLNEGKTNETVSDFSGTLSQSKPENISPGMTGSDWADVTSFKPQPAQP